MKCNTVFSACVQLNIKMLKTLVFLGALCALSHAKEFRFDYEFNQQAGGWLKFHVVPATWDEARLRCHAEGAVLASPLTDQLKISITSFVKNKTNVDHEGGPTIFSGVHATFSKGDYSSVEGESLEENYNKWSPGQPDNENWKAKTHKGILMCGNIFRNGLLDDNEYTSCVFMREGPKQPSLGL